MEKYFSEDVRNWKEMEFLEFKQVRTTMVEYGAKFEELVIYFSHYQGEAEKWSKCVKFINGFRPQIKMMINYHGVHNFIQLVNICRVFDEDQRAKNVFYRSIGPGKDKRLATHTYGKPYTAPFR